MDTILKTEHLCKYYGSGDNQVRAVKDANIAIQRGEFTAIVGKSGSGKSTLLHLLGGLDFSTSGKVWMKDKDMFALKEEELAVFRRRKIGFIFQAFNLVSSINVWENIVLPIGLDGKEVDENFVRDIIKTLGIGGKIHNLPHTLSGGQQQRVAIARALASKPDVILADEPTGNLDSKTSDEVVGIPLGLLSGCGVASVMCRKLIVGSQAMVGVELENVSAISLPLLLVVAIAAFLTVRLALSHPMRVAAKTSPVEAMRYQENTSRGRSVRKGSKAISVFGMTLSNLSANRRRTVSTICTMGLSCVLDREGFERYGKGSALGNVDYDEVAAVDGILFGASYFMADYGYQIGQQIKLKDMMGTGVVCQGKLMGSFGSAPGTWIITQDTFDKLGITEDVTETVWADCRQKDKVGVEEAIQELVSGMEYVETGSYDSAIKQVQYGTKMTQGGIYALLGLLGVIGFLNMANTIITGAVTRKRELGVLQAVGMTNRQLNWMMQMEGTFFSAGTAAISLIVGSPLGYALFCYARELHFYGLNEYHIPVMEIGLMILAIVLLQASLSFLLSRNLRKESLVERITYQG